MNHRIFENWTQIWLKIICKVECNSKFSGQDMDLDIIVLGGKSNIHPDKEISCFSYMCFTHEVKIQGRLVGKADGFVGKRMTCD